MSRLIIIANRLPVRRKKRPEGSTWEISPGGLVSALTPLIKKNKGLWVGWPGTSGQKIEPFTHGGIKQIPVEITTAELDRYYSGFCNGTIWPLYHDSIRIPMFKQKHWESYFDINRRFARRTADFIQDKDLVWVQDYHLQLVPLFLRHINPKLKIGFFNHIPFPPPELFLRLPWRKQILEGLLGANAIGFQTKNSANNFINSTLALTTARRFPGGIEWQGRKIIVDAFPISVDVQNIDKVARDPTTEDRVKQNRIKMQHRKVILGVDRLDYTKGVDLRLESFELLLKMGRIKTSQCVFVQIAVPSREKVPEYAKTRLEIEQKVGHINGVYGEPGLFPVHYIHRNLPFEQLVAYYRSADVMLVTPLKDGMNLVAKEYVSSSILENGVLILSEFAGAAETMKEAILVNPYDINGVANAIELALHLPEEEAHRKMKTLRRGVRAHDVYQWADHFIKAAKK